MRGFLLMAALGIVFSGWAGGQVPSEVARHVTGQTLVSSSLPEVRITFAKEFRYVGGQRFLLYGVADAEQHFFVDADQNNRVRRLYWLQFEHYLRSNDEHYQYSPVNLIDLGGLSFISDTRIYTDYAGLKPDPNSDGSRARALLASRGFKFPLTAIRARMVHLPGNDRRSELMIIYLEALPPAELPKDAKNEMDAPGRFPELSKAVLQHAKQSMTIRRH